VAAAIESPKKRFAGVLPNKEHLSGKAADCLFSQRKVRIPFYRIFIV